MSKKKKYQNSDCDPETLHVLIKVYVNEKDEKLTPKAQELKKDLIWALEDYHNPADLDKIKQHNINWIEPDVRKVFSEQLKDYHNPEDVARIAELERQVSASDLMIRQYCKTIASQMVALEKAREALESMVCQAREIKCTCNEYPVRAIMCERCIVIVSGRKALAAIIDEVES